MRRILEVDEDVYQYLLSRAISIGEDASSILRRELGLSDQQDEPGSNGDGKVRELSKFLASRDLLGHVGATNRYLHVLAFLCQKDPGLFEQVAGKLAGRNRVYVGRSSKEISESGRSTHPQKIPGTAYWALTNASNDQKRRIVKLLMRELGYPEMASREAASVIR